jgi:hypothetical protein
MPFLARGLCSNPVYSTTADAQRHQKLAVQRSRQGTIPPLSSKSLSPASAGLFFWPLQLAASEWVLWSAFRQTLVELCATFLHYHRTYGGERAMAASPKEFREFAQECLRWADETKSERHRQVLLDMAKTWMQAALQLERSLALIDDDLTPPRRSQPRPAR